MKLAGKLLIVLLALVAVALTAYPDYSSDVYVDDEVAYLGDDSYMNDDPDEEDPIDEIDDPYTDDLIDPGVDEVDLDFIGCVFEQFEADAIEAFACLDDESMSCGFNGLDLESLFESAQFEDYVSICSGVDPFTDDGGLFGRLKQQAKKAVLAADGTAKARNVCYLFLR